MGIMVQARNEIKASFFSGPQNEDPIIQGVKQGKIGVSRSTITLRYENSMGRCVCVRESGVHYVVQCRPLTLNLRFGWHFGHCLSSSGSSLGCNLPCLRERVCESKLETCGISLGRLQFLAAHSDESMHRVPGYHALPCM